MKIPIVFLSSIALLATASGAAGIDCSREVKCITTYAPVCGSDGKTYSNQCVFERAVCATKSKAKLVKLFDGACDLSPNPFCAIRCAKTYVPVCGTDGITYSNACLLNGAKCTNVTVAQAHTGACATPQPKPTPTPTGKACAQACPMVYQPVCGTDGVTYGNQCMLNSAACESKSKTPPLTTAHQGECPTKPPTQADCSRGCPKIYLPQCGADGITYNNDCLFEIGKCLNSTLTVAYSGQCATQASACATIKCTKLSECKLNPSTGKGYCADVCTEKNPCAKDEICTPTEVQCITTPCLPVAKCTKRA